MEKERERGGERERGRERKMGETCICEKE